MSELNYLPVNKSKTVMERFIIELDENNYIFEVYWNAIGEYFAFNMFDIDENPIIFGRKITYNVNMLDNIIDERVPNVQILPVNPAVEDSHITYENFMDSVKCYIFKEENDG